jgi:hypothetical protein
MESADEYSSAVAAQAGRSGLMKRAKHAALVLCLFVLYCVLLSQGLKASAASAFFGALAAVPLTVHLYHRVWPPTFAEGGRRRIDQRVTPPERDATEGEYASTRVGTRSSDGE